MDKYLVLSQTDLPVTVIGEGRTTLSIFSLSAYCDKNGRILTFRSFHKGRLREFLLAPKPSRTYDALKFVEKIAVVLASGWAYAATKNEARNTQGAIQAQKAIFGKGYERFDKALDSINDFAGAREWAYYDANDAEAGPILEGPITIKVPKYFLMDSPFR